MFNHNHLKLEMKAEDPFDKAKVSLLNKNKLKSETSADIHSISGNNASLMFDQNEMKPEPTVDTHSPFDNAAI